MRARLVRLYRRLLRRTTAVYVGDNTLLAIAEPGFKIYVDSRDVSLAPHIALDGLWEPEIADAIQSMVVPGSTVVDIGANVGFHTMIMGMAAGASGRVHAIEVNPRLCALLRRSLQVNGLEGRTSIHNVAVWHEACELEFKFFNAFMGSSSMTATHDAAASHGDALHLQRVKAVPLDELMAGKPVDFMKIDCEGSEPKVLAGARETLQRSPRLSFLLEFSPIMHDRNGETAATLDLIAQLGYRTFAFAAGGGYEAVSRDTLLNHPSQLDVLVTRDGAPRRSRPGNRFAQGLRRLMLQRPA